MSCKLNYCKPYPYSTQSTSNGTNRTQHEIVLSMTLLRLKFSSHVIPPSMPNQYAMLGLDLPISLQHHPFTHPILENSYTFHISLTHILELQIL